MHIEPEHMTEVKRILAFWAPGVPGFAFGSRVHGRSLKKTFDLDLCCRAPTPTLDKTLRQLQNAFDVSDIPYRADMIDWHALSPEFAALIESDLMQIQ